MAVCYAGERRAHGVDLFVLGLRVLGFAPAKAMRSEAPRSS